MRFLTIIYKAKNDRNQILHYNRYLLNLVGPLAEMDRAANCKRTVGMQNKQKTKLKHKKLVLTINN